MKITAIIPARLRSDRLPEKLLIEVNGKTILRYVFEKVKSSKLFDRIIIATDSKRILLEAESFGAEVIMTSKNHKTGTDRIAEVSKKIKTDIIVNVQGDEPLIQRSHLKAIIDLIKKKNVEIATLCTAFESKKDVQDISNVKLIKDSTHRAIYFSRSVIPYASDIINPKDFLHHVGLYAFKRKTLGKLAKLKQSPLEKRERLEQLRWIENGFDIYVAKVKGRTISIDTPADFRAFVRYLAAKKKLGSL